MKDSSVEDGSDDTSLMPEQASSAGAEGSNERRPGQPTPGNDAGIAGMASSAPVVGSTAGNGNAAAGRGGVGPMPDMAGRGSSDTTAVDRAGSAPDAGSATTAVDNAGSAPDAGAAVSGCSKLPETCNGVDDDCDGQVDEQLAMECGSSDTSPCRKGKRECVNGTYGECVGAIEPTKDVCDAQMRDDDCDARPNAGCECVEGAVMPCGTKSGVCKPGTQTCVDGKWDGLCKGEQLGTPEVCDGKDNDCDSQHLVDNGDLCKAGLVCKGAQGCMSNAPDGDVHAAIRTANGNYLTFIDGGGHAAPSGVTVAIHTDAKAAGAWETLRVEWQDAEYKRFALKTANGRYITAVAGGGVGRAADGTSYVTTDSRSIGDWEQLILRFDRKNNTVTIRSENGYYLTTVQGGNIADASPIHTDASSVGPFEIFTLQRTAEP